MTTYPDLLPPNSTPLERALSGPTGRLTAIPTPIESVWRYDECPGGILPWLAWAMSVDFWDDQWPDERKRNLIRESFHLHSKKGTAYAIKRYLRYADAELLQYIVPPDKAYSLNSFTADQREAWLGRFPQIRVFTYMNRGSATKGAFCSKTYLGAGLGGYAKPTAFPYQTDAWERWGRRAFLWDKGTHPLATGEFTKLRWVARTSEFYDGYTYDFERVHIPGRREDGLWLGENVRGNNGGKNGRRFLIESTATTRMVTVSIMSNYRTESDRLLHRFAVWPSLDPIVTFSDKVAEPGTSVLGVNVFAGAPGRWLNPKTKERKKIKGYIEGYLPPTTSRFRLFDRLALHDRERLPDGKPATRHLGFMRLGMPAYHAKLDVSIKGKRHELQVDGFVWGHLVASDQRNLSNARHAIVSAMSGRDKILINTKLHNVVVVGSKTRVSGTTKVGRALLLLR